MRKYCKELNCFYGDREQIYDGILVNLNEIPVGTIFHVANGCWSGQIIEKQGEKGFIISETNDFKKINTFSPYEIWFDRLSVPDNFYDNLKFDGLNIKDDWFIFQKNTSIFEIRDFFQSNNIEIHSPSGNIIDTIDEICKKDNIREIDNEIDI